MIDGQKDGRADSCTDPTPWKPRARKQRCIRLPLSGMRLPIEFQVVWTESASVTSVYGDKVKRKSKIGKFSL